MYCAFYALAVCVYLIYNTELNGGGVMPLQYKIDILEALKNAGYSTYRLRKEKILGERIIQQLRNKEIVSWATIDTLCTLLNCQPGDLVEHKKNEDRE